MRRTYLVFLSLCMLLIFPWRLVGEGKSVSSLLIPPVSIGTAQPDQSVFEEIYGGSQLFVPPSSGGALYHYEHLASYTTPGATGTIEIALPAAIAPDSSNSNQVNFTINGYAWPWGAWTVQVGGYPGFTQCAYNGSTTGTAWCGASALTTGAFPYPYVRLGYNTALDRFVVLLGTTATFWDEPTIEVTDAIFSNQNVAHSGLGTGWSIAVLTSEANISTVNTIYNAASHLAVGPSPGEGILGSGNGTDPTVNFEVFGGSSLSIPVSTPAARTTAPILHYRDLVGFTTGGQIGEWEIPIPNSANHTNAVTMTISSTNWQLTVGGLEDFGGVLGWSGYSMVASGNPPFVRLAYDTVLNDYVVVLGTTSQNWGYQTIEVTDYTEGNPSMTLTGGEGSGWAVALVTSEANLSQTVTPAGYVDFVGGTVAASNCGSLPQSAGCVKVYVAGVLHYIPYW